MDDEHSLTADSDEECNADVLYSDEGYKGESESEEDAPGDTEEITSDECKEILCEESVRENEVERGRGEDCVGTEQDEKDADDEQDWSSSIGSMTWVETPTRLRVEELIPTISSSESSTTSTAHASPSEVDVEKNEAEELHDVEDTASAEAASSSDDVEDTEDNIAARTTNLPRFCLYGDDEVTSSGATGETMEHSRVIKRRNSTGTLDEDDLLVVDFSDCQGCDGSTGQSPTKIGVERAIEKILLFTLHPAINGVPRLRIPTAEVRAKELLERVGEDLNGTDECVQSIIAGSEATTSKVVFDFFLERIPFLGCPAVLVKNTWNEIRAISIIAALYGHDVHSSRVKHEILMCLIPAEYDLADKSIKTQDGDGMVADTARRCAKLILKGAIHRATGIQVAADCVELCQQLYSIYDVNKGTDEDGFIHIQNTPTAAARNYFRPRSVTSFPQMTLPILAIGAAAPAIFSNPWRFLGIIMMIITAALLWKRSLWLRTQVRMLPQWCWTLVVFGTHAAFPLLGAHAAITMMLPLIYGVGALTFGNRDTIQSWDFLHWFAMTVLGLCNLSSILIHHFDQFGDKCRRAVVMKSYLQRLCTPVFVWYMYVAYETAVGDSMWSALRWLPAWIFDKEIFSAFWGLNSKVFMLSWISVCAQQKLMEHLKNARELLFRLVGAEHVVASTLCLLLKGVAVIRSGNDLSTFLKNIAPPPIVCCCVIALRSCALWYGIAFALLPVAQASIVSSPFLGVLFGSTVSTLLWGSFTVIVILEWIARKDTIENPAHRLAYLIPGEVSNRALTYLSTALASCQRKAARMMAQGIIDRFIGWLMASPK
eukprot:GEMP01003843.1.p1 GENE.GEMP01003843.1~~GEMP01003843.1.p1  ORF type:complete len:827 (+),score=168.01 GEMP01003843.1:183-2663(+)